MRVVGKRILVKQRLTDSVSKGGIQLPGEQQSLPFGEVVQVGVDITAKPYGHVVIQVGDIILFNHLLATPVGILKDHVLIEYDDVLAILDPEEVADAGS